MFERKRPLISIILPCWFTKEQHGKYGKHETFWFATKCLERLIAVTPKDSYEIIMIDNGSTLSDEDIEHEVQQLMLGAPPVVFPAYSPSDYWAKADILIRNQQNLGFAPACNQGFAIARGEYICCLNDDILVWENWETALIEALALEVEPAPGIVMPALMRETRVATEAIETKEIDLKTNANKFGPGAEFGSLWFCKKELLDELVVKDGYVFDENFKLGMGEDRDLWDRVRVLGYETYRTHNTRVFHQGNMTIGKVSDRKEYTTKNREYLETKRKARGQREEI